MPPSDTGTHEAAASELHDGPLQQLAFFGYVLDAIDRRLETGQVDEALKLVHDARGDVTREIGMVRRQIAELRHPGLDAEPGQPPGTADGPVPGPSDSVTRPGAERGAGHDVPLAAGPAVLVVDDEPIVRKVLVALLVEHGLDIVGVASDGLEAVDLAEQLDPDLVVMDIHMPEMDGKEAARRILAARPDTQIVLLSGDDDPDVVEECLAAGAFEVAMKGGPTGALCETVDRACAAIASGNARPRERVLASGHDSGD